MLGGGKRRRSEREDFEDFSYSRQNTQDVQTCEASTGNLG